MQSFALPGGTFVRTVFPGKGGDPGFSLSGSGFALVRGGDGGGVGGFIPRSAAFSSHQVLGLFVLRAHRQLAPTVVGEPKGKRMRDGAGERARAVKPRLAEEAIKYETRRSTSAVETSVGINAGRQHCVAKLAAVRWMGLEETCGCGARTALRCRHCGKAFLEHGFHNVILGSAAYNV